MSCPGHITGCCTTTLIGNGNRGVTWPVFIYLPCCMIIINYLTILMTYIFFQMKIADPRREDYFNTRIYPIQILRASQAWGLLLYYLGELRCGIWMKEDMGISKDYGDKNWLEEITIVLFNEEPTQESVPQNNSSWGGTDWVKSYLMSADMDSRTCPCYKWMMCWKM